MSQSLNLVKSIYRFVVRRGPPNLELELLIRDTSIVTVGSFDIGENYQACLEEQLDEAISTFKFEYGGSGSRIVEEIVKVRRYSL
jgi:hypothetical protein